MGTDFLELAILDGATPSTLGLPELEQVIERGQQTFIEVGRALLEIRDRRLYRETHATFETYCRERWGWGVRRAQQIMAATRFAIQDTNHGSHFENERQVRAELSERREPEPEKWQGDKGVLYTTGEDDWLTPPHIIEAADVALGGIDLDPCASLSYIDNVPAAARLTVHEDGLSREWAGRVYMNPPYGRPIGDWTSKLAAEAASGNITAYIALVPARTDTRWFADFSDCLYCFIRGRLSFGNMDQGAPFPSVAVYYGPEPKRFAEVFGEHGLVLGAWSG